MSGSSSSLPLFLGLDASTQALKASLIDANLAVSAEIEVRFDRDLGHYGTKGGTHMGPDGSGIVNSPVMMNVEAIDLLFDRIHRANWPVKRIRGVSAAGQQHASVYWSRTAEKTLGSLSPNEKLATQLTGAFSRQAIPNWQDSSTLKECKEFEDALGGQQQLAQRTGSKAHARFTGPQIMRFRKTEPDAYKDTARISLVSSFMTSMLCLDGEIKGIDESDACGMNLWDMSTPERGWVPELLKLVSDETDASELERKLGTVESDGGRVVGHIGQYYVERYGFSPDCIVCPGTGDNPATFLSFTLRENEGLASLGTSDTVLVSTSVYNPDPEFHAFFHPAQIVQVSKADGKKTASNADKAMRYFNMLVYKNGSLAREYVRDQHFGGEWDNFNRAVEAARPRSSDDLPKAMGFWWLKPDIIPSNASGVYKFVDDSRSSSSSADAAHLVKEFPDPSTNGIAMLESQLLNYRSRSADILGSKSATHQDDGKRLSRIYATGGASANSTICSVMADVLGCNVCKPVVFDEDGRRWKNADWNACSVAAAYKAAWAYSRHAGLYDEEIAFDDFAAESAKRRKNLREQHGVFEQDPNSDLQILEEGVAVVAQPDEGRAAAYSASISWWSGLEQKALQLSHQN